MFAVIKTLISKWWQPRLSEPQRKTDAQSTSSNKSIGNDDSHLTTKQVNQDESDAHFSDFVPYDENLLERSRTQWQFGDWESLAALNRETLQHHPDRAKLALLAAAGKMQKNQMAEARKLIQLAQDWGVSRKLVTQILASGVHNSLACMFSLSGQQSRAIQHFESAIAIGAPGVDGKLVGRARMNEQLQRLNHSAGIEADVVIELKKQEGHLIGPANSSLNEGIQSLSQSLIQHKEELDTRLKVQADGLIKMRKFLDASMKKEVTNIARQIEATIGLQSYFATGELPNVNTERHKWPISPDFALYLIELIEINKYDIIVEFGSGLSTVIIAKTIDKLSKRREGRKSVEFISFDHLDKYYQRTCDQLQQAGLRDTVSVEYLPLQDWQGADGVVQPYYKCESTLAALAKNYDVNQVRVLVIVDGPPTATAKHARYPAGPIILKYFGKARLIDILLDDFIRDDEKEIVNRWQAEMEAVGISFETEIRSFEKDACLIRIDSPLDGLAS